MEDALYRALINAGVGGLIALLIVYLAYRLLNEFMVKVGSEAVLAFKSQADALTRQALSMEALTTSLQEYVTRDNGEHREIIILLKVMNGRFQHLEERLNDAGRERKVSEDTRGDFEAPGL